VPLLAGKEARSVNATSEALPAPSRRQAAFLAVLVLLFVLLGARHATKVAHNRSAFVRWQPQIELVELGVDISARFNYPNPPIMAVLLEPLAKLPPAAGAMAWFALKALMALVSLWWVFRLIEREDIPFPDWAKALAVLCGLKPIVDDLNHGNVNLFILFLVAGFLTAYRRRRDFLAGLVLALAIACKVTPGLFVPYLLWKRSWRALGGCAVGLVLFFYPGLVPGARLGWVENQAQLASWYRGMVRPFVVEGKVTSEHVNQSLHGLVHRLATRSPSFVAYPNNIETPTRFDNFLTLTSTQAGWLVRGSLALFAVLVAACCRTPAEERRGWRAAAEWSVIVLGMLLFSERTWKHHCVTLVLPLAVLWYHLAVVRSSRRLRAALVAAVVVVLGLLLITGIGFGRERALLAEAPGFAKMALVYGAYTFACLTLLLTMTLLLLSGEPSGEKPSHHQAEQRPARYWRPLPEALPAPPAEVAPSASAAHS
jgi:hypothetical protein